MANTKLEPAPGYVLVELGQQYEGLATPAEKYNTSTEGVCIKCNEPEWIGKRLFWEEFNASKRIEHDGKTYAFIKIEDIRGYETDQNAD